MGLFDELIRQAGELYKQDQLGKQQQQEESPKDPLSGASANFVQLLLDSILNPQSKNVIFHRGELGEYAREMPGPFGAFTDVGNLGANTGTGAARQLGTMGNFPIGQVDVRTPLMQALEMASAPLLLSTLLNPTGVAQGFGDIAGPVPGIPQGGLASMLFGDSPASQAGANGSTQTTTTTQQQQATPPPVQTQTPVATPPTDPFAQLPPLQNVPTGGTGNMFGDINLDALNQLLQQGGYRSQVFNPATIALEMLMPGLVSDPTALSGFRNNLSPATLFNEVNIPGFEDRFTPSHSFANPEHLLQFFTDPGSAFTNVLQPGMPQMSPAEFQAWVNNFEAQGGQTRATGGLLDPNATTLVGEQGPELITPQLGGQQNVVPLGSNNLLGGQPSNPFATSASQGPGTGMLERLLQQNPEQQAFQTGANILGGQGGILGSGGGGQGVVDALRPVFEQNLQFGLNELTNRVPSVRNSASAIQGADLTSRALNDFNLLAAQALQQGQQNTLGGLGLLGQLAGQAGGGQFGRALGAGQLATQRDLGLGSLGLQAQQQQFNQTVNPTLQLLLAAMGMATPTAFQTIVPGKE